MFGRRRRGYGGGGIGLFLLAMQLHNFLSRNNRFFPVLMGVLALNVVVYLRPDILQWPSVHNACISASKVWLGKKWQPLLYSAFTHANDYHLYYNMASFMWKAATLEQHFGSAYFLYMTSVFTALTGVIYVGIKMLLVEVLNDWSYMSTCAVGFSGVVFALKVVTTHLLPPGNSYIMGIPVPSRLACWAELVLISVITPNASFVGHLAGIFVGLAFVWGPLKFAMDAPLQLLGFFAPRDVPGGGGRRGPRFTNTARTTGYRDNRNSEEEELQAAIRLSRNHYQQERQDQFRYQQQRQDQNQQQDRYQQQDHSDDVDLQAAIERSVQDSGGSNPLPPTDTPSPVNPYHNPLLSETDSGECSSSSISTSPGVSSSSLPYPDDDDRMPVPGGNGVRSRDGANPSSNSHLRRRPEARVVADDRTAIRDARLRRFDKTS